MVLVAIMKKTASLMIPQKKRWKTAYYARRAQELAESQKAFVTAVSRNVNVYRSSVMMMNEIRVETSF